MPDELDYELLDRKLDQVKAKVLLGTNAAFLGPLMCSLNFYWDTHLPMPTACTNGVSIRWDPYYFLELIPEARLSILLHELWHVALMHMVRQGTRRHKVWNEACDTVLDCMMDNDGYNMTDLFPVTLFPDGGKPFNDHQYDNMSAEEIYEIYIQKYGDEGSGSGGLGFDLVMGQADPHQVINIVIQAYTQASMAGNVPGNVEEIIKKFLKPKLPWETLVYNWMNDKHQQDFSWARPNRRYQDMYLPSMQAMEGLESLNYYMDVSGSVTTPEAIQFNSEVKHIWDVFRPKKLTIILFDTEIQKKIIFQNEDEFNEIVITGRGGTDLVCVRDHIIKTNPVAAIIFSDMQVEPMEKLPPTCKSDLLWVATNAHEFTVNQGKIVHMRV